MRTPGLMMLAGLLCCMAFTASAQSKKEQIAQLTHRTDSLHRLLTTTNDSLHRLELKLAHIQGATETRSEMMKHLEDRADSLRQALSARNTTIESQTAKISQLNSDLQIVREQEKQRKPRSLRLNLPHKRLLTTKERSILLPRTRSRLYLQPA